METADGQPLSVGPPLAAVDIAGAVVSSPEAEPEPCLILSLPSELKLLIFSLLDGESLLSLSATCRALREIVTGISSDDLWKSVCSHLVRPSLPREAPMSPAPYVSYRALFNALRLFMWFTPGLWHGNREIHGTLYLSRYNPGTGHIEVYSLLGLFEHSAGHTFHRWSRNPAVLMLDTRPMIQRPASPILRFSSGSRYDRTSEITQKHHPRGLQTSFVHAAALSSDRVNYKQMKLWPPLTMPARDRTRNDSPTAFRGQLISPLDASPYLFRLRQEISFAGSSSGSTIKMAERVETIARVPDDLLIPDEEHPYRGLWIADYDSHGGEFMFFHQPTANSLHAVKLTGDPNVPRGEYTFLVDDLSHTERIATEEEWPGARVVAARGQTAAFNFTNPTLSPTQLILISPDVVCHYWINVYRITIYRRVDVDDLISGGSGISYSGCLVP
ncbi:uncharacterized protein V1518DRAFT_413101 [Limtongia smithiae]|uniref:uncharacterized protein n=1 Tax=Limtongia smithiae TaxID=1125753 RepID=UPI0034CEEB28